jgi:hypothetical protein
VFDRRPIDTINAHTIYRKKRRSFTRREGTAIRREIGDLAGIFFFGGFGDCNVCRRMLGEAMAGGDCSEAQQH